MGTVVSFLVYTDGCTRGAAQDGLASACLCLHRADEVFSTWKPSSPVSRLRRAEASLADMPAEVGKVLGLCERAKGLTGGWFDPWAMPGGVDPTGLVKGWAADEAMSALVAEGVTAAMVNAGGDITCCGTPPGREGWRVGIRHPWQPAALAAVVRPERAVATSGSYERPGQLVDPGTGGIVVTTASATVTGASLATADALATALAVGGEEVLRLIDDLAGYEAYRIDSGGGETSTSGIRFVAAA